MMADKKIKSQTSKKRSGSNFSHTKNRTHNNSSSLTTASSLISINQLIIHKNSSTNGINPETRINMEGITFVCLDLPFQSITNLLSSLQEINDYIQIFTDPSICLDWLRSSTDSIFFISSSGNRDLITAVHTVLVVEAIFILNWEAQVSKTDIPKLAGVFSQHEQLLMALRDTLTWFERSKLEVFVFENDKAFLWSQLWKEKTMNTKLVSSTGTLAHMARNYYQDNKKILVMIDTFRQLYRSNDALRWCLRSPFPARSLNYALRSHDNEQLSFYSFLLNDVRRVIKQHKRNSATQLYKGMKICSDLLDNLVKHAGELICTGGFFICTTSRTAAWSLASSPSQRSDLLPVVFNIICDRSVPFAEISIDKRSDQIIFDAYTTFRIMHVNKGKVSIVKMKTANKQGKQMATEYTNKSEGKDIDVLLYELSTENASTSFPSIKLPFIENRSVIESADEIQAQKYLTHGKIDLALTAYQRIKPISPRILNIMGQIYTEKLNNNENALKCHLQALEMQEKDGKDTSETLYNLGIVRHNRHEFDLALSCHTHALTLREAAHPKNDLLIANSLRGVANAHWARRKLPEALDAARRALIIHQTLTPINETNVATSWATMANIYHDSGDDARALELGTRAVSLLESCEPANSSKLAALYYNLAAFQLGIEALLEARYSFEKALKIYTKILSSTHPMRITIENHIQSIIRLQRQKTERYLNDSIEY